MQDVKIRQEEVLRINDPHMNNNNIAPTVQPLMKPGPTVGKVAKKPVKPFEPKPIEPTIDPIRPEILAEAEKKRGCENKSSAYPEWLLITVTYSVVFISIILMSNITPNGKLYIHFTAFWSMVLYFFIDDVDHTRADVLDSVVENFVKVRK